MILRMFENLIKAKVKKVNGEIEDLKLMSLYKN